MTALIKSHPWLPQQRWLRTASQSPWQLTVKWKENHQIGKSYTGYSLAQNSLIGGMETNHYNCFWNGFLFPSKEKKGPFLKTPVCRLEKHWLKRQTQACPWYVGHQPTTEIDKSLKCHNVVRSKHILSKWHICWIRLPTQHTASYTLPLTFKAPPTFNRKRQKSRLILNMMNYKSKLCIKRFPIQNSEIKP